MLLTPPRLMLKILSPEAAIIREPQTDAESCTAIRLRRRRQRDWSTGHLLVALQNQLMLVELQRQWVLAIPLWGKYLSGVCTLDTEMEKAGFC